MKKDSHILYEKKPATAFEESYLLGNGSLGASVFFSPERERVLLNHDTLWSGYPRKNVFRGKGKEAFDRIKALVGEGRYAEADSELSKSFASYSSDAYLPLGELNIDFLCDGKVNGYKRYLDLSSATATCAYKRNGVKYESRAYVSAPDSALIYKINCASDTLSAKISLSSMLYSKAYTDGNRIYLEGEAYVSSEKNIERTDRKTLYYEDAEMRGMRFLSCLELLTDGRLVNCGNALSVVGASYLDLRLTAETSYNGYDKHPYTNGKDYRTIAKEKLDALVTRDSEKIYQAHIKDYKRFYDRVSVDFGSSDRARIPTSERLKRYADGGEDKALVALLFNFGRYLTVSASREGSQPMNLQGIWNPHFFAPWHSNYTTNINAEMNYFPTLAIGLPEMFSPFIKLVSELSVTGRDSAEYFYGAKGWVCHHNTDLWRHTHPVAGQAVFLFWNAAGAWMCNHLYGYYEYTLDEEFLINVAYPIMREAARFYLSQLCDSSDGYRIVYPSTSPENYYIHNGERVSVSETTEMTMSCVRELFKNYLDVCEKFDILDDITDTVRAEYPNLRPIQIASDVRILEWFGEREEAQPTHRHLSHLYALYPGCEADALKDKRLCGAFKKSLDTRGDEGTGWSLAWKCALRARLLDGEHAFRLIRQQLRPSNVYGRITMVGGGTYPNMTCAHPPFQIDGNFGVAAGISEMLLQSTVSTVHLLPACPRAWCETLEVKGLLAKGKRKVDLKVEDGVLTLCKIYGTQPERIYLDSVDVTDKFVKFEGGVRLSEKISI